MELDIGKKIQSARKEAKLTQEQVAEKLGVSRQTISNWENEKNYPDIVSVIRMSEIYQVSLDYLLKGERVMAEYYEYLEESTNVVKSNRKKTGFSLILSYVFIWTVSMIVFWNFTEGSDAMGYSIMFLWLVLPVTTFVISVFVGIHNCGQKKKWFTTMVMGIMYMLAGYGTFSMANMISFHKFNLPDFEMIIPGVIISSLGIAVGNGIRYFKSRTQ